LIPDLASHWLGGDAPVDMVSSREAHLTCWPIILRQQGPDRSSLYSVVICMWNALQLTLRPGWWASTMRRLSVISRACGLIAGMALVAACAGGQSPAPALHATSDRICITETPMGSHMPKRTCRSRAEVEAERKAAREALERIGTAPSVHSEQG